MDDLNEYMWNLRYNLDMHFMYRSSSISKYLASKLDALISEFLKRHIRQITIAVHSKEEQWELKKAKHSILSNN